MSLLLIFWGYDPEGREWFRNRKGEFFFCERKDGNKLILRKANIPQDISPNFYPTIIEDTRNHSLYIFLGVYKVKNKAKEVYWGEDGNLYSLVNLPILGDKELLSPLDDSEKEIIKRDIGYLAEYYGFI
jgi:hypothetical protein